jgi:hypothetical protein
VVRSAKTTALICSPEQRIALAADIPFDLTAPQFHLDDVTGIANFIEREYLTAFPE